MTSQRPNPDALLARVQAEESIARRGKLKIFFGYAAGVGKTYAMLTAAQREKAAGVDVVIGYVEPHGRLETEALLAGLEVLATRQVPYHGVLLKEFDLDAALARQADLILIDELAHSNADGARHAKRWQDVEELIESGVDVWTTLNVQHVESLNDVIAQITKVLVRETLPDAVLEKADEIELIDLTPEELVLRLQAGKVYLPVQAERALANFFQRGNLLALRELSLRQAAHRLHQDVEAARQSRAEREPWATREKILVCVGPSPSNARILRAAKRMTVAFGGEWLALAVDEGGDPSRRARELTALNLQLAEHLGAETHMLIGQNVVRTLLDFARSRNVTKIVAGKTALPWWRRLLRRTLVEELLAQSGEIDIYVIKGEGADAKMPKTLDAPQARAPWTSYAYASGVVLIVALLSWLSHHVLQWPEANTVMIFLAGVAFVATRCGRGPALSATLLSVLIFDYYFVLPYNTFAVSDTRYVITFGVMLGIGLLISAMAARQRERLHASQVQEQRTSRLLRMTRQLSEVSGADFLLQVAGRQLREFFGGESVVFLREAEGNLTLRMGSQTSLAAEPMNATVATWVANHGRLAGLQTDTFPSATALFVPLIGSQRTIGALGVRPTDLGLFQNPEQRRLVEACASLIALSIERDQSVLEAQQAQLEMQAEQLRNSLFSSVSHDLRTPLTVISGHASNLREQLLHQATPQQAEILQTLVRESHQLVRLVENLLDMAKLESGLLELNRQWQVLEEIIGSAIERLRRELGDRKIAVDLPIDFPLIHVDGLLLEQVLANLLENVARYTPPDASIQILARTLGPAIELVVSDNGPGLPPNCETKIFEKFYRGASATADGRRGVGLGLAICQGMITAHGGRIVAANRASGGAKFMITLPCQQQSPNVTAPQDYSAKPH
jgi:two-component system sensor histidine kinase KdpD